MAGQQERQAGAEEAEEVTGNPLREPASIRPQITFPERWLLDSLNRALDMLGCKTDKQRSRAMALMLAAASASVCRGGVSYDEWRDNNHGLNVDLWHSPPPSVEEEMRAEMWASPATSALTEEVAEELTAEPQASRHKASAWL